MEDKKLIEDLKWRYATKKFDPDKKITSEDLSDLLEALRLSPSSFGLEPWKFIVVTNKELREKLRAAAWGQPQITDASHLIVLCARKDVDAKYIKDFIKLTSKVRKIPEENLEEYSKMIQGFRDGVDENFVQEWNKKQVYIALGFLLTAAAEKRIDSCPMEGFEPSKFDKILGLDEGDYTSTVLCPVGYRSKEDSYQNLEKVRFESSEVIEFR